MNNREIEIARKAPEYAKHNQCCIPIHDKANIAEIRFEKIRDAYLAGHTAGRIARV